MTEEEMNKCQIMYINLLEKMSDVLFKLPASSAQNIPGYKETFNSKNEYLLRNFKNKINLEQKYKETATSLSIYSEPCIKRPSLNSPDSLIDSKDNLDDSSNGPKRSFIFKTRKSISGNDSIEQPSTSSIIDRVKIAADKLQPIQSEVPKVAPAPASSVPFQPPISSLSPPKSNIDKESEESAIVLSDEADFEDLGDWPEYRPEDYETDDILEKIEELERSTEDTILMDTSHIENVNDEVNGMVFFLFNIYKYIYLILHFDNSFLTLLNFYVKK